MTELPKSLGEFTYEKDTSGRPGCHRYKDQDGKPQYVCPKGFFGKSPAKKIEVLIRIIEQ